MRLCLDFTSTRTLFGKERVDNGRGSAVFLWRMINFSANYSNKLENVKVRARCNFIRRGLVH